MRAIRAALTAGALVALVSGCGGSGNTTTPPPPRSDAPALGSLSSSGAGHRFYEIYEPSGPARGTMLVIHGGAFQDHRGDARQMEGPVALTLRAQGWRVVNIGYTPGIGPNHDPRPMIRDVVAFYDQVRQAFSGPVCAYGDSAGGYLAGMLAVYRPSLSCAILNAAPLDLPTLHTIPALLPYLHQTFGTSSSALAQWSPARDWDRTVDHTPIFATAAADDQVVPSQQLLAFHAADPSADVAVLPGGPFPFGHSFVDTGAFYGRISELSRWLERIVPSGAHSSPKSPRDIGAKCDQPPPDADRFGLLLSGDAWRQAFAGGQTIAATRGCSGSDRWQDDGISLWALPNRSGGTLREGAQSSLTLDPGRVMHVLTVAFRGFLQHPENWRLGLYSSTSRQGPVQAGVAICDRGSCSGGLRLYTTGVGGLIASSGSGGDPDQSAQPQNATFNLPAGTRRVAWKLQCVASSGCSLKGIANAAGVSPRALDPLGHPAIFSLYRVEVG